jgi:hypothetical protein
MAALKNLTAKHIPLQKRYDDFVVWISEKTNNVPELIAVELEVEPSVVDVFFELANFDTEEFAMIDKCELDIDELFIIVRTKRNIRMQVYENAKTLLADPQPLKAIREFIDNAIFGTQDQLLRKVSSGAWKCVAKYLKSRSIEDGTITRKYRSLLVSLAKYKDQDKEFSDKQIDWLVRGILHDHEAELRIFTSNDLKNSFKDDYILIEKALELIKATV